MVGFLNAIVSLFLKVSFSTEAKFSLLKKCVMRVHELASFALYCAPASHKELTKGEKDLESGCRAFLFGNFV